MIRERELGIRLSPRRPEVEAKAEKKTAKADKKADKAAEG